MGLCLHASCGSAIGKARLRVYCQCAEMVKALEQVCIRPDVTECCVPHISHFAQVDNVDAHPAVLQNKGFRLAVCWTIRSTFTFTVRQVRLLKQLGMAKEALSAMESQTAAWQ